MLNAWNDYDGLAALAGELHFAIKDPVTDVVIPYPLPIDFENETVPQIDGTSGWTDDDDPRLPPHIQIINNMIENGELPCEIDLGNPIVPNSSNINLILTKLKPQKLYNVIVYNAFEVTTGNVVSEQVHEYVFQTSRYESFEKQVRSYQLDTFEVALAYQAFTIEISATTAALNDAYDVVANPGNQVGDFQIEAQYQELFDRVTEGILGIKPIDPPERTEFLKVIDINTGNVIAIWIRNPEPFNDPKIPLEEVEDMIQVVTSGGAVDNSYKVLLSKDYSQAFIMRNGNNITAESLNFKFKYVLWDGSDYQIEAEIVVENIVINN